MPARALSKSREGPKHGDRRKDAYGRELIRLLDALRDAADPEAFEHALAAMNARYRAEADRRARAHQRRDPPAEEAPED